MEGRLISVNWVSRELKEMRERIRELEAALVIVADPSDCPYCLGNAVIASRALAGESKDE